MFFDSDRRYDSALHKCERCTLPTAQQYAYVDKHGDIHELCGTCYHAALHPVEPPELAQRDRIVAVLLLTFGAVAIILWLTGCATRPHKVEHRIVAGKKVEIHTDAPEDLEPACQEPWIGCYSPLTRQIFLRSPVADSTREHELAHAEGMQHTPWSSYGASFSPMRCALVLVAGGKYKAGQMICKRGKGGEEVFTDATFSQLVAS